MTRKPRKQIDDPEQSKRFMEAARQAEADESEQGAQRAFEKIAKCKDDKHKDKKRG